MPEDGCGEKLEFPLDCHYRIIARNIPHIEFVIETVLAGLGVPGGLKKEKESGGGKYVSFSIDVRVESKERMNRIDAELRAIEGVKMVL